MSLRIRLGMIARIRYGIYNIAAAYTGPQYSIIFYITYKLLVVIKKRIKTIYY